MKKVSLVVVLMMLMFCNGCIGLIGGAAVMLDRHLCKKKGIEPPQVHPALKKIFQKKEK